MPLEIETKIKVEDHDAVRSRLRECSATRIGEVMETNAFLDTPDRALLREDRGLRVRENRDLGTGASTHVVTYKGPRQSGALKTREEREVTVASSADAIALLEALGFTVVRSFPKRRESWSLGDCRVELDELPGIGTFVEIEGASESAVSDVTMRLGLRDRPHVDESYIAMVMQQP